MLRISTYLIIAVVLVIQGFSSVPHYRETKNHVVYSKQYPAYIFIHNRSNSPVIVTFNGNQVGSLGPGNYFTWTVAAGYGYHIRTYWQNGNYNYWDAYLGPQQTYRCLTGY